MSAAGRPRLAVVVVTMGDRPRELAALLASVRRQSEPAQRVLLIGNGADPGPVGDGIEIVRTAENLGCPGGRNVGLDLLQRDGDVDVVVELDDDGLLVDDDVFAAVRDLYEADRRLGIVAFRIADENGDTQRRHVPRLRTDDPMRGGEVTAFLGGAHAFALPMLDQTGTWPAAFFFGHEESDLAWRALDAGWRIVYDPALVLQHPRTSPGRHSHYLRMTARNRVWLARRRLPWPLVPMYLGVWTVLTVVRLRSAGPLLAWARGFVEGLTSSAGERRPMRWRTVWRMTRLGRPPVI